MNNLCKIHSKIKLIYLSYNWLEIMLTLIKKLRLKLFIIKLYKVLININKIYYLVTLMQ